MIKTYKLGKKTFYQIQLSITDGTGKRHQPKYKFDKRGQRISSKYLASELKLEYRSEYKAKLRKELRNLPFKDFHEEFLKRAKCEYRASTYMQYDGDLKKWLTPSFKAKKLCDITQSDLYEFIYVNLPERGATPHTQQRILKTIKKVFSSALDNGHISRNPAQGITVKVQKTQKLVLNTKEAFSLLEQAKLNEHPFYYHWAMALLTGMRNGELYALRWSNVDLASSRIHVTHSWSSKNGVGPTKSNENRTVPISNDLKSLLVELQAKGMFSENLAARKSAPQVFDDLVLPRSSEWRHGEQAKITRKFCEIIGIKKIRFHDLRATFITSLLSRNISPPHVMSIVGHSSISTTNEYLRLAGIDVKGVTDQLGYKLPELSTQNVLAFKGYSS